ncbi:DNRLRE domain-containing protein [Actinoplanes siamensis]|uniref:DNRLRE domain-containing protein n=1 Tax=Actinoplanes siamensis TaxID=1223317 RepID=UPI001940BF16|nr:DNRLRE domain-containing protein [Actinoplanes siamensis]
MLKRRPSKPVSITVPMRFAGLTARTAAGNSTEFIDTAGKVVGVMAAPSMWGSELDAVSQLPSRTAGVAYTLTPRDYGVDVTLTPDMAFLTDPATQYPVTIDPDVNFKGTFDTYVKQNTTTDFSASSDLAVGVDTSGNPARAFLNWDPAPIRGSRIEEAHLGLWNSYSATCGNRAINVYSAGLASVATRWAYSGSGSGTTGQPSIAATASGATNGSKGQASCAAGYIATNPHDLDQLVQGWANTTSGQIGMALKAPSETDVSYFKRILSGDNVNYKPFMYVTYNPNSFAGAPANDSRFTENLDPKRTSNSFPVSGTLRDKAGNPIPNLDITVSLDPSPAMLIASETDPDAAVGLQLAGARTDADGHYSVKVPALKDINKYIDEDGNVTLLITGFGSADLVQRQLVKLPTGTQTQATSAIALRKTSDSEPGAVEPEPEPEPSSSEAAAQVTVRQMSVAGDGSPDPSEEAQTLDNLDLAATKNQSDSGNMSASSVNPATECKRAMGNVPWSNYKWQREFNPIRQWVPVQRVQTKGRTTLCSAKSLEMPPSGAGPAFVKFAHTRSRVSRGNQPTVDPTSAPMQISRAA